jgi:hypothetical protein
MRLLKINWSGASEEVLCQFSDNRLFKFISLASNIAKCGRFNILPRQICNFYRTKTKSVACAIRCQQVD